jgi:RNA polymerase sigma-70 factor (sigma-E family)
MHWLRADTARREFERFVTERTDQLLRTAYLVAWDLTEAEDLVQETLLQVARRWPRVAAMEHPAAYARKLLVNLAIDTAQKRARRSGELTAGGGADATQWLDQRAARDLDSVVTQTVLLAALAALPARQRAIIVLRYWEDLPEAEVAAVLGCSVGTVKSTASRGLARLREQLGHRQPGDPALADFTQATTDGRIPR